MTALSKERVGRITGSRVAAIVGVSPYGDRQSVMRQMVRERLGAGDEFVGNIATEYGKAHEQEATAEYERYRAVMVHNDQAFYIHPTVDYLGCTPDGLVGETGMVELKCPFRAAYTSIDERPDYFEQVQLQLAVLDREWCDFVVWRPSGIAVTRVGRDPGWLVTRGPALDEFIAEYEAVIYDPDRHATYLDAEGPAPRDDFDWQLAAVEYLEANAALQRAEEARSAARQRLIDLAAGEPAQGGGVALTIAQRKGSIDYSKAAKDLLAGVDFEPYRKPATTVQTVRVAS